MSIKNDLRQGDVTKQKSSTIKKYKFTQEDVDFIYNLLRRGTTTWSGRAECLKKARRKFLVRRSKKGKLVYKYHWKCAVCKDWFRNQDDVEVDHIVEIGGVTSFNGDWNEMIFKIMPRPIHKHLQCLCGGCHMKKTRQWSSANNKWERKK